MKAYNLPLLVKLSDPAASFQWNIKHKALHLLRTTSATMICGSLEVQRRNNTGTAIKSNEKSLYLTHILSPSLNEGLLCHCRDAAPWVLPKGRHSLQLGSSWKRDLQQEKPWQARPFKAGAHFFYLFTLDLAPDISVEHLPTYHKGKK